MHRLFCILLLTLLPLHSFAVQGGWLSAQGGFDIAHEMAHQQGESHHHEDDGSIHYDDSGESDRHLAECSASCQQTAALSSFALPHARLALFSVLHAELWQYIPDPIPERPQRPPQSLG